MAVNQNERLSHITLKNKLKYIYNIGNRHVKYGTILVTGM
jgi:hypothetical protein